MSTFDYCTLMAWAATLPLIPYAWLRRLYDALASLVILFGMLSISVMILLERPNPDHVRLIQVVAP